MEARPIERAPAPLDKLVAEAKASFDAAYASRALKPPAGQGAAGTGAAAAEGAAAPEEGAAAAAAASPAVGSLQPAAAGAAAAGTSAAASSAAGAIHWSSKAQDVKHTVALVRAPSPALASPSHRLPPTPHMCVPDARHQPPVRPFPPLSPQGYSPDEAWDEMYRSFPTLAFTGEHFGLHQPEIAHLLEGLGGADKCQSYQFVSNWVLEVRAPPWRLRFPRRPRCVLCGALPPVQWRAEARL